MLCYLQTSILNANNNSFPGPLTIETTFEKQTYEAERKAVSITRNTRVSHNPARFRLRAMPVEGITEIGASEKKKKETKKLVFLRFETEVLCLPGRLFTTTAREQIQVSDLFRTGKGPERKEIYPLASSASSSTGTGPFHDHISALYRLDKDV